MKKRMQPVGLSYVKCWGMDSFDLAQDINWWRELVNAVINLRAHNSCGFHTLRGISRLASNQLCSQEGLYFILYVLIKAPGFR